VLKKLKEEELVVRVVLVFYLSNVLLDVLRQLPFVQQMIAKQVLIFLK
jgi:hypothetical protein